MRLGVAGLVFVAITGAGCGGAGSAPGADPSSTQATEAATLQQTCPQIEAALPKGFYPRPGAWSDYSAELERLRAAGDTETQNALSATHLIAVSNDLAAEPGGIELLDARDALREALDMMATRCRAVGSSALQ